MLQYIFKLDNVSSSPLFSFFKIVLAIPVPLYFHITFRISLSISTKNTAGILIGIALNL